MGIASEAAGRACVWDGKSLLDRHAHIDGVDSGRLPFSIGPCLLLTRAARRKYPGSYGNHDDGVRASSAVRHRLVLFASTCHGLFDSGKGIT
jgi:hypothetical protein